MLRRSTIELSIFHSISSIPFKMEVKKHRRIGHYLTPLAPSKLGKTNVRKNLLMLLFNNIVLFYLRGLEERGLYTS